MKETRIRIPDGLDFADLELQRQADGSLSFNVDTIEQIRTASDLPADAFDDEGDLADLITGWYQAHRELGGAKDAVAEHMLAEETAAQAFRTPPGRA